MRKSRVILCVGMLTLSGCNREPLFSANFNADPIGQAQQKPAGSKYNHSTSLNSEVVSSAPLEGSRSLLITYRSDFSNSGGFYGAETTGSVNVDAPALFYQWTQSVESGVLRGSIGYERNLTGISFTIEGDELAVSGQNVGTCDFSKPVTFFARVSRTDGTFAINTLARTCRLSHSGQIPRDMNEKLGFRVPFLWFAVDGDEPRTKVDNLYYGYERPDE